MKYVLGVGRHALEMFSGSGERSTFDNCTVRLMMADRVEETENYETGVFDERLLTMTFRSTQITPAAYVLKKLLSRETRKYLCRIFLLMW